MRQSVVAEGKATSLVRPPVASQVCCFDSDLEDSIVLAVVIQSHVPHCQAGCKVCAHARMECGFIDDHRIIIDLMQP